MPVIRSLPHAYLAPVIGGLALLLGGGLALTVELQPFLADRTTSTSRVVQLAQGEAGSGLSISADQTLLLDCRSAMSSAAGQLQPPRVREALARSCLAIGDGMTAKSPTLSEAYATGAMAAGMLGDADGLSRRLVDAQASAPAEQWLARLRVAIADRHFAALSEVAVAAYERDVRLLLVDEPGIASIAYRYLEREEFRARVDMVVATLPPSERERFARWVRKHTAGG